MRRLRPFTDYKVDYRLRRFRKVTWQDGSPRIEDIDFASDEGLKLIGELEAERRTPILLTIIEQREQATTKAAFPENLVDPLVRRGFAALQARIDRFVTREMDELTRLIKRLLRR